LPPVQALHVGAAIAKVHRCARRENTKASSVTVKGASNHTDTVLIVRLNAKEHDINRRARASRRSFQSASPRDCAFARVPIFFQFLPPYTATAPRNNSSYERNHPTSVSFTTLFHRKRRVRVASIRVQIQIQISNFNAPPRASIHLSRFSASVLRSSCARRAHGAKVSKSFSRLAFVRRDDAPITERARRQSVAVRMRSRCAGVAMRRFVHRFPTPGRARATARSRAGFLFRLSRRRRRRRPSARGLRRATRAGDHLRAPRTADYRFTTRTV